MHTNEIKRTVIVRVWGGASDEGGVGVPGACAGSTNVGMVTVISRGDIYGSCAVLGSLAGALIGKDDTYRVTTIHHP